MIDKLAIDPGVRTYYNCYLTERLQIKLVNKIENIYPLSAKLYQP